MNEYGEILNCADITITILVITHTIVPINLHWAPKVRQSVVCTCAPNENEIKPDT